MDYKNLEVFVPGNIILPLKSIDGVHIFPDSLSVLTASEKLLRLPAALRRLKHTGLCLSDLRLFVFARPKGDIKLILSLKITLG